MAIYIGSTEISKVFKGSTEISKLAVGATSLYESSYNVDIDYLAIAEIGRAHV